MACLRKTGHNAAKKGKNNLQASSEVKNSTPTVRKLAVPHAGYPQKSKMSGHVTTTYSFQIASHISKKTHTLLRAKGSSKLQMRLEEEEEDNLLQNSVCVQYMVSRFPLLEH